jgi:20S proteasome alpha/beta subunit
MTVCIAALATEDTDEGKKRYIVTVSDTKLTTGIYSQEFGAWKIKRLSKHWSAMIAGKFSQHRPIIEAFRSEIGDDEGQRLSVSQVHDIAAKVYVSEAKRMAEETILGKFGLTVDAFLKSRKNIGDSLFERTWGEISRIEVGCDLLVFGFDDEGPHIFVVSNPTPDNTSFITDHDSPSFAAIGTGSYLAESTMFAFNHTIINSLSQSIYHTTVAKFVSESASDVGERTVLFIVKEGGDFIKVPWNLESKLRERWKTKGRPMVPEDALESINKALNESKTLDSNTDKTQE